MSNVYQFQTEDQVYEDASLWVARLDRGLSGEETGELRRWLDKSARHRECLLGGAVGPDGQPGGTLGAV